MSDNIAIIPSAIGSSILIPACACYICISCIICFVLCRDVVCIRRPQRRDNTGISINIGSNNAYLPLRNMEELCVICHMNPKSIAFEPCKHVYICSVCHEKIIMCPICYHE